MTDLPPSAKLARRVLEDLDGEATRQELLEETDLQERTLDYALNLLEDNGEIVRERAESDLRAVVCNIHD